jgi:hypothetical protein
MVVHDKATPSSVSVLVALAIRCARIAVNPESAPVTTQPIEVPIVTTPSRSIRAARTCPRNETLAVAAISSVPMPSRQLRSEVRQTYDTCRPAQRLANVFAVVVSARHGQTTVKRSLVMGLAVAEYAAELRIRGADDGVVSQDIRMGCVKTSE